MKFLFSILISMFGGISFLYSQTISGNLSLLAGQSIKLEGFNGLNTYPVSSATIDDKGNFKLSFSKTDYGVGYLISSDNKPLFVILDDENVMIQGEALSNPETLRTLQGKQNIAFEQYAKEHPRREQALSAWVYLEKIYSMDSLFAIQKTPTKAIQQEMQRIRQEDQSFLASLPKDSYVSWFLPTRKLVSSVSTIAQYRTEEIPGAVASFRSMDYTDVRLYKSGLFKDAIESHFWLLENCGKPLDSVFIEMQLSIDAMMPLLVKDEKRFNEVTEYLFDLLEKRSLFRASEYLALKVLNETSCTVNSDLAKQLETYRAMKKGNTAPDIVFSNTCNIKAPGYATDVLPAKLSDIKTEYTVIAFGAGWCPRCNEELPEIAKQYQKWKANGVEVILVSLDENADSYQGFVKDFPFITLCDFKKWDGQIVKDYYVFGTPTMFLLNNKREILLRPNSVK
ncbi:MAG: peroxiredoxin family protein, partial [Bacteroidota bacterium]